MVFLSLVRSKAPKRGKTNTEFFSLKIMMEKDDFSLREMFMKKFVRDKQ